MRRIMSVALVVGLAASAAHAVEGRWTADLDEWRPGKLHLGLSYTKTDNMGTHYDVSDFSGLTVEAMRAASSTPVTFSLQAEAGKIVFEGSFKNGKGSGHFTFEPNVGYLDKVRALGVDVSAGRHPYPSVSRDERLLFLTLFDVSIDYIRSMIAEGYRESLDTYQEMRLFDVTPAHIREMRAVGFQDISSAELVAARIHGVTPEYVREMRAGGWDLSLDELQSARIFNVTPAFREEMARIGYRLSLEKLTAFRIHGVTPEWIEELKKLGFDRLSADDLLSTRIFNVTPGFIQSVRDAGHPDVTIGDLISMRVHGQDARSLSRKRAI